MEFIDNISRKLDRIDELFPAERINKSKERWRRLWNGEPPLDRLPFTYSPISASYWSIAPKKERLMMFLDEFILRGQFEDDFIPAYFAGCHQGGMATLFGAKPFEVDNAGVLDTNCSQLFMDIDDARRIEPPRFRGDTIPERWLAENAWCIETTGGRLPVHVVDSFGPVEISAKLWGFENLYMAAYEEPELYDIVMSYATDAYIMFVEAQRECAGDLLVETSLSAHDWVETGKTISVGMDSMVMISPQFFIELCLPYLKRIADRFAPLTVHACGWYKKLIAYICETPVINALHTGQMTLPEIIDAGGNGDLLYIPASVNVSNLRNHLKLLVDYSLRANLTIGGLWKESPGSWNNHDILEMKKLHEDLVIPIMSDTSLTNI